MTSGEFKNLYTRKNSDDSISAFTNEVGFSLIRKYPEGTPYHKDDLRMFIKVGLLDQDFFYSVNMTKPEKGKEATSYILIDGEGYKRKVTNFFSDDSEFSFNEATQKLVHKPTGRSFSIDEFIEVLVANHLSDRLFFKRILNEFVNQGLKFIFWLSDAHYEQTKTAIDKYRYDKGEIPSPKEEKGNIEPFFKYFYISKNILFVVLLISFPSAIFWGHLWIYGTFSLSNPSLVLLFFLILFSCEKFSIWLNKKIKEFVMPSRDLFSKNKVNFLDKLHEYQYKNKFKLKLKAR